MKQIPEKTYHDIVKSLAYLVDWDCNEGLMEQRKIESISVGIRLIGVALEKNLMDDVFNYCVVHLGYLDPDGFEECDGLPFDDWEEKK